jgi:hypothetical protein
MNRIAELNDQFRRSLAGGKVMITAGVDALPISIKATLIAHVRAFDAFGAENDPYGEHDFGAIDLHGRKFFWKIDTYAPDMLHGSEDPADPTKTVRVLTIMLAEEY